MEALLKIGSIFGLILFLCCIALVVIRLMGHRTVGQLSPFDFIIMVGIGDIIVTTAMDKNQTILSGIGGLLALLVLQQILSYLSLKNNTCRRLFEGTPVVLIRNGEILKENFSKSRFNYDDLRQEMHKLGMDMTEVKDIRFARLESCGVVTIIKNQDLQPVTKRDLENYGKSVWENPLSPLGQEMVKLQKMMQEVHEIAQEFKDSKANK